MGFTCQYPIDFRVKVLSEYKQEKVGYKTLANKYGLKRDTVRYWVLQEKSDSFVLMDTKNKETVDETQKDIEFYRMNLESRETRFMFPTGARPTGAGTAETFNKIK